MTYPNSFRFWDFFVKSVPMIIVFISTNFIISILVLVFVATPPILLLFDKNIIFNRLYQAYYAIIFAVMLSIAAIGVGRGSIENTIDGRHKEFLIIIFPIIFLMFKRFHVKYHNTFSKLIFICFILRISFIFIFVNLHNS